MHGAGVRVSDRRLRRLRLREAFTPRNRWRRGLTLIEQVIVLIIFSVIVLIFLPFIATSRFFQTDTDAAGAFGAQLQQARNAAIMSNQVVYFEIDLDEDEYRAYRMKTRQELSAAENESQGPGYMGANRGAWNDSDEDEEERRREEILEPTSIDIEAIETGSGGRVRSGRATVRFLPNGTSEQFAVFFGEDGLIETTLIYNAYGGVFEIVSEERGLNLENPRFYHAPESR